MSSPFTAVHVLTTIPGGQRLEPSCHPRRDRRRHEPFPVGHLISWAGLCPTNDGSPTGPARKLKDHGKRQSNRMRKLPPAKAIANGGSRWGGENRDHIRAAIRTGPASSILRSPAAPAIRSTSCSAISSSASRTARFGRRWPATGLLLHVLQQVDQHLGRRAGRADFPHPVLHERDSLAAA
jgi:hypothetical protein